MMGYAETRAKIEHDRLIPWASSISHKIAGYEVLPLTLSSLVDLQISKNFLVGVPLESNDLIGDVLNYLWRHTKYYKNNPSFIGKFHKYLFLKKVSKLSIEKIAKECLAHFEYATEESPAGVQITNDTRRVMKMSASPTVAYLVDEVCAEYNVTISEVMNMPIKKMFQLMRCIRLRKRGEGRGGDITYPEPKELKESIKAELEKVQKKAQQKAREAEENG